MNKFKSPNEWSEWIISLYGRSMEFSLDRIRATAEKLDLLSPKAKIITVGGTNGKGSTVAGLEKIYLEAGYKVGAFTSPYLLRINELIRVQGQDVDDETLCRAFEKIEHIRDGIRLTPFEFNTLAAFIVFRDAELDLWILEVGLGGRLDAVNVLSADAAIIASIDLDHAEWLGNTRDQISREKAGIFRKGRPAVYGDLYPPASLLAYADQIETPLYCHGRDFGFSSDTDNGWTWWGRDKKLENLPVPPLSLQNMTNVLMMIDLMQTYFPVDETAIRSALAKITLPGRIQILPGEITRILDVSHNPAAAEWLAGYLRTETCSGKTIAVFSMLADKDILRVLLAMKECVDVWHIASLHCDRSASLNTLSYCFRKTGIEQVQNHNTIVAAYQVALSQACPGDRIVVFGSFHTVAGVSFKVDVPSY